MSNKFKPGDMVEIIFVPGVIYGSGCAKPGLIGEIICYLGEYSIDKRNLGYTIGPNAWEVKFPNYDSIACSEKVLKLIPGNQDCKDVGNWDSCPWSPYAKKENQKQIEEVDYDF
jgi:hypothetical protein